MIKFNTIASITVLPLLTLSSCTQKKTQEKPNIIFLLTDDQRWDALGAAGNQIIETPNLDILANNGVMFQNSYVTTAICCCSRASILTGQYVSRHGINSFQQDFSEEQVNQTYPLLLKEKAGYKIGFIGKYGIGLEEHPADKFDYWTCEKVYQPNYEGKDANNEYLHYTDKVKSDILNFLDIYSDSGAFCLSVSFKAPHVEDGDPRQFIYHPRYKDLFKETLIPVPETAAPEYWDKFPADFKTNNEARNRWDIRFSTPEKYQESVKGYYRLIKGVDDVVGEMRRKLEEKEISENTIIIFMGDNGFYLSEHGMAGKWYAHEESLRVPFIIYNPRYNESQKGKKIQKMALNIDVAPTILSLAGIEVPEDMQGESVLPIIADEASSWRTDFFYEHTIEIPTIPKSRAIVTEEYKYIEYPELESGFKEFYDRVNDPKEKYNLISDPRYSELIGHYSVRLDSLMYSVQ
ncbi:MAG: sulfatase [Bacteroidales bacterium]|nr:sulfatase [Bacteroidales bacterium]